MADLKSFFSKLLQKRHAENADLQPAPPTTQPPPPPIDTAAPISRPRLVSAPGTAPAAPPGDELDPRAFLDSLTPRPTVPDIPTYTPHEKHGFGERVIGFFRGGHEGGLAGAIEGARDPGKQEFRDWYATKYAPAMQQRQAINKEADDQAERKIKAVTALSAMTTALSNKKKTENEINKPLQVDKGTELGYVDPVSKKFVPYTDSEGKPLTNAGLATAQVNSTARLSEADLKNRTTLIMQKQKEALERFKQAEEMNRLKYKTEAEYRQAMDVAHQKFTQEIGMAAFNAGATTPDEQLFTPSEEEIYNYQQANKVDRNNAIEGATRTKKERYYRENKPKNPLQGKEYLQKLFPGKF